MDLIIGLLIILALVSVIAVAIQSLAKAGLKRIESHEKKQALNNNVFVKAHKQMLLEKQMHPEYIKWMDENNIEGVPFDVTKSHEEVRAELEIQNMLKSNKRKRSR